MKKNWFKIILAFYLVIIPTISLAQFFEQGRCWKNGVINSQYITRDSCTNSFIGGTWQVTGQPDPVLPDPNAPTSTPNPTTTTTPTSGGNRVIGPAPVAPVTGPAPVGSVTVLKNPIEANSIPDFIRTILEGVIKIGISIVALAIVYCGFLFVFARGNSEKLTKAKDALLYTIIGAAVLLGSLALAKLIQVTITGLGS